jgi:hypothetical protein
MNLVPHKIGPWDLLSPLCRSFRISGLASVHPAAGTPGDRLDYPLSP